MKATGIVRKIDNLGRIVIPAEIRSVLHIKEGDPMEIYTDDAGAVIIKKYSSGISLIESLENIDSLVNQLEIETHIKDEISQYVETAQRLLKEGIETGCG